VSYLLLCVLCITAAFSFKPADPVTTTLASIVHVASTEPETGEPTICTGFVVAPHRAITATHCIFDESGFTVNGEDSILLARSEQFALVSVSPALGSIPSVKFAKRIKLQEPVLAFGFAWGDMFVLRRNVATFKDGDFAMDGPLAPGMSGGPTVNLAGEVVGLNQAANNVIGIDCGVAEIRKFLEQAVR
jgi:S1-C subfamily serine protease